MKNKPIVISCVLFIILFILNYFHYTNLNSSIADFGFFLSNIYKLNLFWQVIYTEGHIQPILFLFKLLTVIKDPEIISIILIFINSFIIASSFLLITYYYGYRISLIFILFTPIWILNILDFHLEIILLLPELFLLTYYKEIKNTKLKYFVFTFIIILLCITKEIYAIQALFVVIYYILIDKKNNTFYLFCLFSVLLYNILLFNYIIPFYNGGNTALNNNNFTIIPIFESNLYIQKIKTVLIYFLPVLFVIFRTTLIIWCIPFVGVLLLSSTENYVSYNTHYYIGMIAPIIASSDKLKYSYFYISLFFSLLILIIFSSSPFSRYFYSDKISLWNFKSYILSDRNKIIKNEIYKLFKNDNNSVLSVQNSINNGYISYREWILPFPLGINKEYIPRSNSKSTINGPFYADFVIYDFKKPLYIIDKGCNFIYQKCLNKLLEKSFYFEVSQMKSNYNLIFEYDEFYIYKRK